MTVTDLVAGTSSTVDTAAVGADAGSGHGVGDSGLMAFAAERSRLAGGSPVALPAG